MEEVSPLEEVVLTLVSTRPLLSSWEPSPSLVLKNLFKVNNTCQYH
jgi:hypothetical protein